jgi:hypothetical protein
MLVYQRVTRIYGDDNYIVNISFELVWYLQR